LNETHFRSIRCRDEWFSTAEPGLALSSRGDTDVLISGTLSEKELCPRIF
jgi:hypothetical protein